MLYEISCNFGSRDNGIPLYIYLTYTLCIMAVILQTRCFQMDNCEPDLSFSKYVELDCFRWLYIYGHICDFHEIQITPIAASWAFHPGLFTESLADLHVKFTNKAEFMVMDYWTLKIPCLKTTWNINCGKFKNPISTSKHENISGDETGFTVTKRSRAKDIPSMLLCLVFNINKHGQPLGHMHETWLICIK